MEYISQFLGRVDLGENLIYRGHSDQRWVLRPSVGRHYEGPWFNVIECEMQVLGDGNGTGENGESSGYGLT